MTPIDLDNSTNDLLEDLKRDFFISFKTLDIDYCEVFQKNNIATIFYNPKFVNNASIAHELLHIWLKRFNYSIGNHVFLTFQSDAKLGKVFNKALCDHMSNCCDHNKMYSKYLEMGYSPADFVKNGLNPKACLGDVVKIKLKLFWIYNSQAINVFIGSLFSILADHVENDYTQHHTYLRSLDPELYSLVLSFWNKWNLFNVEKIDPINNSDIELTNSFIDQMSEWIKRKIVI